LVFGAKELEAPGVIVGFLHDHRRGALDAEVVEPACGRQARRPGWFR
jgi:hypothetical protein